MAVAPTVVDTPNKIPAEDFSVKAKAEGTTPSEFGIPKKPTSSKMTEHDLRMLPFIYGATFKQEPETFYDAVKTGAINGLAYEAQRKIDQNKTVAITSAISNPDRPNPQEALVSLQTELNTIDTASRLIPKGIVALLSDQDPAKRDYALTRLNRVLLADRLTRNKITVAESDNFATNFDFVDYLVSSPQNLFILNKQRNYADKYAEIIYSQVSDEEMTKQLDTLLTEMSDQGLFTNDNRFYLNDFVSMVSVGSEGKASKLRGLFSLLDTGLTVGPLAVKGVTTVSRLGVAGSVTAAATTTGYLGRSIMGTASSIAMDAARLVGYKTNNPLLVRRILDGERIMDDPLRSVANLANNQSPSMTTTTLQRPEYWSATSSQAVRAWEEESQAIREALDIARASGSAVDDPIFETLKSNITASVRSNATANGSRRFLDTDVVIDELDNVYLQEFFGTHAGAYFNGAAGKRAAQNFADQVGGEVVVGESVGTFMVKKTTNIPIQFRELSLENLNAYMLYNTEDMGEGALRYWAGSPLSQTDPRFNGLLQQAYAAGERWRVSTVGSLKEVERLNTRGQRNQVWAMFDELNHGSHSQRRTAFTEAEFRTEFRNTHNIDATDAQVAMYLRVQNHLDVDAMFKADYMFKEQIAKGVVVRSDNGYRVVPTRASKIPATEKVWDDASGGLVDASTLNPETIVYRNFDPLNQNFAANAEYITGTNIPTRRLYHSDVMARNPGGPRDYRKFSTPYFIKQERTKFTASGNEVKVSPLTVMAVRTEKEAAKAITQINSIIGSLKSTLTATYRTSEEFLVALRGMSGNTQLDNVIAANSEWFPSVHSVDTLVDWASRNGVDLRKEFQWVEDGKALIDPDVAGGLAGTRYSFANDARAMNPFARKDEILYGYGGVKNEVYGAGSSIPKTLAQSASVNSERAYTAASINSLMKTAISNGILENLSEISGMTLRQKLMKASFKNNEVGRKLELERKKILFRMQKRGFGDAAWESAMRKASDFLYDTGAKKTSQVVADVLSTNPLTALRGIVFDMKLGMFNPVQLYIQASQTINIMAIAGIDGIRGTSIMLPMRAALMNGDQAVIKAIGQSISGVSGLTADEFLEMVTMFKNSGRSSVGSSVNELSNSGMNGTFFYGPISRTVSTVREKGRFFFNEGELMPRMSAYATAYVEFGKKFPNALRNTPSAQRWIMNRQDVLTQGMTSASRTPIDQVPFTQFLSYTFRINEAIFAGSLGGKAVLNAAEKFRLAVVHTALFGASAWTATGFAMDWYKHNYGTELDDQTWRAMRKGAIDTVITELTGVESSLASRLSNSDGMFMLMKDFAEQSIFTAVWGPSGQVGVELTTTALGTLNDLAKAVVGKTDFKPVKEDLIQFARLFSTGNQAYNAYTAFRFNEVMTRNNALLDSNVSEAEAIFGLFGVPIERHEDAWKFTTFSKFDKVFDKMSAASIQKAFNTYATAFREGDYDQAKAIAKAIALKYSSMSPLERQRVDRLVYQSGTPIIDSLVLQALRYDSGLISVK